MTDLFHIDDVSLQLENHQILDGVSFRIEEGERLAIIGANGSGKSTLLNVLTGFRKPDHGSVRFKNQPVETLRKASDLRAYRAELGMVYQGLNLVGRLSVMQNVLIGRLGRNQSWRTVLRSFSSQDRQIAEEALKRVNLLHKAEQRTDSLSGGERQRVAIARAIAQESRIIIADEPTSALDPLASREIGE